MILLLISFIAGVLTILAPCTLPLLPVIVGSSMSGSVNSADALKSIRRSQLFKAFTISISLGASVVLFTLLLKFSALLANAPQYIWPLISGSIIIIFGLTSLFPAFWEKIPGVAALNVKSNKMLGVGYKKKGLIGDIIIGASLGPVFSTCSPTYFIILATVLPQSFLLGLTYLIAYAVGLGGMIMLIAVLGQRFANKLGVLSDTHGIFKKTLGVLFILLGVSIIFGVDKIAEEKLSKSGIFDITKVEQRLLSLQNKPSIVGEPTSEPLDPPQVCTSTDGSCPNQEDLAKGVAGLLDSPLKMEQKDGSVSIHRPTGLPMAPELVSPDGYINTDGKPVRLADFKGKKVVLLDVWTYSCINCQRTLPYVNAWYGKYKDQGLEIIGLHTPEFSFEKIPSNVEEAVKKLGIKYPVVLDNKYATWNAYGNTYWPRKYLINEYGEIVYDHIGEGNYDETEMQIQKALAELNSSQMKNETVSGAINKVTSATIGSGNMTNPKNKIDVDPSKVQSPEVYLGFNRNTYLANGKSGVPGTQTLVAPRVTNTSASDTSTIELNKLYLGGTWNFQSEYASTKATNVTAAGGSGVAQPSIIFKYNTKNVYMVLSGSGTASAQVGVYLDGVKTKTLTVKDQQLYTVVEGKDYGVHIVELRVESGSLDAYTFTFG